MLTTFLLVELYSEILPNEVESKSSEEKYLWERTAEHSILRLRDMAYTTLKEPFSYVSLLLSPKLWQNFLENGSQYQKNVHGIKFLSTFIILLLEHV
jgi:hypothetical protein